MSISSFDKAYTTKHGVSNEINCPICSKKVALALFENIDASPVSMFLGKDMKMYFAVCPACASVFDVNPNYMKERQKGTTCFLTPDDLKVKGNA